MTIFGGLLTGLLFGVGLVVGGMTQPAKVMGFLDFGGAWDPTLMFVMAGALLVYAPLHRVIRRRSQPLFWERFETPLAQRIDTRLMLGSALFGAGWGLGGFCPGPGLVSAGSGAWQGWLFTVAMGVGMVLHHGWARWSSSARPPSGPPPDA